MKISIAISVKVEKVSALYLAFVPGLFNEPYFYQRSLIMKTKGFARWMRWKGHWEINQSNFPCGGYKIYAMDLLINQIAKYVTKTKVFPFIFYEYGAEHIISKNT